MLTLKTAWADGTRQLVFEPLTLLEKLAALTPRPRINLVLYHGVLAPHAGWRARGPGAAVGRVAGHQPRRCTQRLSAIRRHGRRGFVAPLLDRSPPVPCATEIR